MSDHGFSVILGRPFSTTFRRWFRQHFSTSTGQWNQPLFLHATLVNCTRPNARSLQEARTVLSQVETLRRIWLDHLVPIVQATNSFELTFRPANLAGTTAVLPTSGSFDIAHLIRQLQGNLDWIGEEDVVNRLASVAVVGVNKFASGHRRCVDTVSVTLGRVASVSPVALPASTPPPEQIEFIRLAYYRDRSLADSVVSNELPFNATPRTLKLLIDDFCDAIV